MSAEETRKAKKDSKKTTPFLEKLKRMIIDW